MHLPRPENLHRSLRAALVLCLLAGSSSRPFTVPARADAYDDFSAFAMQAFGAEREPLVYEWFGGIPGPPKDVWEKVSATSVALGFSTNLPTFSHVEYGPDDSYGRSTPTSDRAYAVHLHHLTGLEEGVPVHYRIVTVDERGTVVRGRPRTVTPDVDAATVRLKASPAATPFVLDRPGATYVLAGDLDAPGTAFEIRADGITLDLDGHTVTYDNEPVTLGEDWPAYRDGASFGVKVVRSRGARILNGTLRQGAARSAGHARESIGFNPVYLEEGRDFEIAGLVLDYAGDQLVGLYAHYPGGVNPVHHNVFLDRGTGILYRHGTGCKSMAATGDVTTFHTHHNLVKRTRQSGLDGALVEHNEIYVDSYATNSYGIPSLVDDREAHHNRIFGTGYHVVGLGWGSRVWWHDNFVHLVGRGPDERFAEYGNQESLNGIRLTQYQGASVEYADVTVEHNLVVITGGGCSSDGECTQARGLQWFSDPHVTGNVIRGNTIKVVMDATVSSAAALVTEGQFDRCGTESPVLYEGNRLIANITNVRLGDRYGAGCNHVFVDNELVRAGDREDYRTLRFDYPVPLVRQEFYGTGVDGGASLDNVAFSHPGQELTLGDALDVVVTDPTGPVDAAEVLVQDAAGKTLSITLTDPEGRARLLVPRLVRTEAARRDLDAAQIVVRSRGREQVRGLEEPVGELRFELE